jgi:ubiquinone/menaquinone biosynthesis C-methylase UbiE
MPPSTPRSVLGEIPSPASALAELRRVLKPDARLLICEVFVDPDFISLPALQGLASDAGFVFERQAGSRLAYAALFRTMAGCT